MLWLNGGPGCSSLIGCYYELGPWIVGEDGVLRPNPSAWNRKMGILFVDSPVGTGFSVAESDMDIPTDQERVAEHLQYALQCFMEENPTFRSRPLFLAGESYAGKYVPALAYYILHPSRANSSSLKSQLAGIAIGNGLTDPRTQDGEEFLAHFLNAPPVKRALGVDENAEWVSCRRKVRALMAQDTMKSVTWMVEAILRLGYPVLLYQGIYDVKDGPSGSEAWMRTLDWEGASEFWKGERNTWKVKGELAGYWRRGLNLTHVVVAGAGHQVPADQPEYAKTMIDMWMKQQLET
ncbi:hypothetical protein R1sor_009900 [Riccia sorocarpa]|uniref:Carboxypeptidase n=1 Tax=Riccia sorocarpa TaxID=122646 RepID=A0ABD3I2H9_9MARC